MSLIVAASGRRLEGDTATLLLHLENVFFERKSCSSPVWYEMSYCNGEEQKRFLQLARI